MLIEWCFKKFEMKKKLSKAAVSLWFSEKKGKRSQKEKLELVADAFKAFGSVDLKKGITSECDF